MLIVVLRPNFAERFQYSVRVCDLEMKSQLLRIEREKLMQTSWRQQTQENEEKETWKKDSRASISPKICSKDAEDATSEAVNHSTPSTSEDLASKKVKFILQIVSSAKQISE